MPGEREMLTRRKYDGDTLHETQCEENYLTQFDVMEILNT
jgi:hypothetical protein